MKKQFLNQKDLLGIRDLTSEEIWLILERAESMKGIVTKQNEITMFLLSELPVQEKRP